MGKTSFAIDKIQPPCTFYYEDVDGNKVPFNYSKGMPDHDRPWYAQHSKGVVVQSSIVFAETGKDKLIVRFLKWAVRRMPSDWKKSMTSMSFNTTINSGYPLIKYFVEERGFKFNDACVVVSTLCGRCSDICEDNLKGVSATPIMTWPNQYCSFCDVIDPDYVAWRKIWCCYRTMKMHGNVAKAYKEISPNSGKGYFKSDTEKKSLLKRIKDWVIYG